MRESLRKSHGGGVACYIREDIKYTRRYDLESESLECMWLEFKQKGRSECFLGVYYRKPDTGIDELNELEENCENVLALSSNNYCDGRF